MALLPLDESALVWSAVVVVAVLIVYVDRVVARLHRLEQVNRALLSGAMPSDEVRQLARLPDGSIPAMTAYRRETGADVRAARAVVQTLRSSKP